MPDTFDMLPAAVLVVNSEHHIVKANSYSCQLLGYTPQQLIGQSVERIMAVASRIYFQTHIYPIVTLQRAASEVYLSLLTSDRVSIPVLLNAVAKECDGGQLVYFAFMPVHQRRQFEQELINARRQAEEALFRNDELVRVKNELETNQVELDRQLSSLKQRNDELEQFSRIIAHDLQEPLRKLMLFADLLQQETDSVLTPVGQQAIASMARASGRMRHLIRDLQFYFTQTSEEVASRPVSLDLLLNQVTSEFRDDTCSIEVDALPDVMGSEAELGTLFRHLIDNAVKFRRPDTPLAVHIAGTVVGVNRFRNLPGKYDYADYARITVTDNGMGFGNEHREAVFMLLKKLHGPTPGIGIGLAIARKIAERHGGQISAQSTPGQGTTITLLLPIGG